MQKGKPKGFQRTVSVRDKNLGHLTQKSMTLSSSLPCWGHPAKDTGWICKSGWVCAVVCPPQQAPPGVGTRTALQSDFSPSYPVTAIKRDVGLWNLQPLTPSAPWMVPFPLTLPALLKSCSGGAGSVGPGHSGNCGAHRPGHEFQPCAWGAFIHPV